jgi:hypothetical protein
MVYTLPLTRGEVWDPIPLRPPGMGHNLGQTQQAVLKHHIHILDVYDISCERLTPKFICCPKRFNSGMSGALVDRTSASQFSVKKH